MNVYRGYEPVCIGVVGEVLKIEVNSEVFNERLTNDVDIKFPKSIKYD